MRYRSFYPRDLFADLDRLQREIQQAFDISPSIRGLTRGFPAMNIGGTAKSVEIYAFAPGVDPASLEVHVEKGVLTVAGERKLDPVPEKATTHIDERFAGPFADVVTVLPWHEVEDCVRKIWTWGKAPHRWVRQSARVWPASAKEHAA
jgi:HSP20 family protein